MLEAVVALIVSLAAALTKTPFSFREIPLMCNGILELLLLLLPLEGRSYQLVGAMAYAFEGISAGCFY